MRRQGTCITLSHALSTWTMSIALWCNHRALSGVCLNYCVWRRPGYRMLTSQFTMALYLKQTIALLASLGLCRPLVFDYLILSKRNVLLHLRGKALCLAPTTQRPKGIPIGETLCTCCQALICCRDPILQSWWPGWCYHVGTTNRRIRLSDLVTIE